LSEGAFPDASQELEVALADAEAALAAGSLAVAKGGTAAGLVGLGIVEKLILPRIFEWFIFPDLLYIINV
jgi:hypothetical protein